MKLAFFALLLSLTLVQMGLADFYRYINDEGELVKSDSKPPIGVTQLNLEYVKTETTHPYKPSIFSIITPEHDATYQAGEYIKLSYLLEPIVNSNFVVKWLHNGNSLNLTGQRQSFLIHERGSHAVKAQLVDETGQVIEETAEVSFYVNKPFIRRKAEEEENTKQGPAVLRRW